MDISNFDKASVLATLYNHSKVQGMGIFQAESGEMTKEEAQKLLDESEDKYFDYLKGKVMKISLADDQLDTRLYNRDNGAGAAERAIAKLNV
jgi:hypothetical protein